MVELNLYAVQVFEDDYMGGKLTYILGADKDDNYYTLYYLDSVEVYSEDDLLHMLFRARHHRLIT